MIILADILGIGKFFQRLFVDLNAGIYKIVGYAYQIFMALAETNIFSQSEYQAFTDKIYIVLGVLMLFVIAYNILLFIVDPDKNKGGSEVEKMLKKIVVSLILIVLCPALFRTAFDIQDAVFSNHVIENFFSDTGSSEYAKTLKDGGNIMAGSVFEAFISAEEPYTDDTVQSRDNCHPYKDNTCSLAEAKKFVKEGNNNIPSGKFSVFRNFDEAIQENRVDFAWLLALIAGGYLVYVVISFCFDLAVRVVKLAFYQIIAPLCIACRIIPNKESIFTNWWKAVSKTFISVFTRVFIMNIGIYFISLLSNHRSEFMSLLGSKGGNSTGVQLFAYAFLVLGIVTFMKQAFKLVDEIFGLGDVKLGLREKMAEGGLFTAGAIAGGGLTSLARNAVHGVGNVKKAWEETKGESKWKKAFSRTAAIGRGIGSTVSGGVTGAYRGGKAGWKAASGADMKKAASTSATQTTDKRDEREAYRAAHNITNKDGRTVIAGSTPFIGGIASAVGHVSDVVKDAGRWMGIGNVEELQAENKSIQELTSEVASVAKEAKELLISKADSGKTFKFGVGGKKASSSSLQKANGNVQKDVDFSLQRIRDFKDLIAHAQQTGESVRVDWLNDSIVGYEQKEIETVDLVTGNKVKKMVDDTTRPIYQTFSAEELNHIFGKYMSDYSKEVANVAFKSDEHYAAVTSTLDIEEEASLSKIHEKADKARKTLQRAAGSTVVKKANEAAAKKGGTQITVEYLKGDIEVTNDSAVDKLESAGTVIINENNTKINEIRQQEKDSGKK